MGSSWTALNELGLLNYQPLLFGIPPFTLAARFTGDPTLILTNSRFAINVTLGLRLNASPDLPLVNHEQQILIPIPNIGLNFPYGFAVDPP